MADTTTKKTGTDAYRQKIEQHRSRIRRLQLLVVLLLAACVVLVVWLWQSRRYTRTELTKISDFVAEEGAQYLDLNGYIVQYGPNGAVCVNGKGKVVWNVTYEMDRPIVSVAENVLALADYGGRKVYVFDTRELIGTIETNLPIHMLAAASCGEVAVVTDDSTTTWVRLFTAQGQEIAYFVRSMEENGYPIAVAVSPDGEQVCMSSLRMQDSAAKTYIAFYDFGSAGQSYAEHEVGSYDYRDEVFPYLYYMDNGTCVAASDARTIFFDTSGVEPKAGSNHMLQDNLQGIFGSSKYMGLLFADQTGRNLYRLELYGKSGDKVSEIGFTLSYDRIRIERERVYINNDRSCQIYDLEGHTIFSGGFDRSVRILVPTARLSKLLAVSENEIDRIRLR